MTQLTPNNERGPDPCPVCGADPDAAEAKLLADVAKYGWHVMGVTEDDEGPAFAYSIGLYRTWQHPEIIIFGLGHDVMHQMINNIVHEIKNAHRFADGDESGEIIQGYDVTFRTVPVSNYKDYFGYALWFYNGFGFPALQCLWPDCYGRYPWDDEYPESMRWRQPAVHD